MDEDSKLTFKIQLAILTMTENMVRVTALFININSDQERQECLSKKQICQENIFCISVRNNNDRSSME